MTGKNRKNNSLSDDKAVAGQQHDEAAKKSPKVAKAAESATVSSTGSGPRAMLKLVSALVYVSLAAAAVAASLYLHRELSDIRHTSSRHEESLKKCSAAAQEVEQALQQMRSMKISVQGLEGAVVRARTDLESTSRAVQQGEANTRQMEDTLLKLQKKIFQDLTEGIREMKDAREKDISLVERTLEERLSQLSRSMENSIKGIAGEQSHFKNELGVLRAHLDKQDTSASLKQELTSINSAIANLNTANEVAEGNTAVLREQIAAVGAELQTRNKEVLSVSEEIQAVRTLMQNTMGSLREEVSAARASVQTTVDQAQTFSHRQDQLTEALQSLEKQLRGELLKVEKDMELRMKTTEDSQEVLAPSLLEQTNRLDTLISQHRSHKDLLDSYKMTAEEDRQKLRADLQGLRSSLEELQTTASALEEAQNRLEQKLEAVRDEESSRATDSPSKPAEE